MHYLHAAIMQCIRINQPPMRRDFDERAIIQAVIAMDKRYSIA